MDDGDVTAALAAVAAMVCLGYPPELMRLVLGRCHPGLDAAFLDPALVPAPLLLAPVLPAALAHSPLDARRLAYCHGDDLQAFVRRGLNRVLRGELPLYSELPPVPIEVVRESLWCTPERRAWLHQLSVLECLALEAVPAAAAIPSALRRWRPSELDRELQPTWVWLELAAATDAPERTSAQARLRAMGLGFGASRVIAGPADGAALVREACRYALGNGARYVLWTGAGALPACWGDWIRGLVERSGAPLVQCFAAADGVRPLHPPRPRPEPSAAGRRCPLAGPPQPRAGGPSAGALVAARPGDGPPARPASLDSPARPWRALLLLAVTAAQLDQLGEACLRRRAEHCALEGGFEQAELLLLERPLLEQVHRWMVPAAGDLLLVFQGLDDRPLAGAWQTLRRRLAWESAELLCSDEELIWGRQPDQVGLRQLEGAPTPFRVLTRGAVPGLVAVPAALIAELRPAVHGCLHALLRDLALEVLRRGGRILQLPQVLLRRDPITNPAVLAHAPPLLQRALGAEQQRQIAALTRRHAAHWLTPRGTLTPGPRPGTFMVRRSRQPQDRVSVLIPFRDQAALTRRCVQSLLDQAEGVPLEIVLIDNGSTEPEAIGLASELQALTAVPLIGMRDERPFNFAALNNAARPLCSGNFLLFLNNDIVLRSPRAIEQLLDPFGFQGVGAVSARLLYGDGRIQHQGLMAADGRVHEMHSPGKRMRPGPASAMVLALEVQEQWSAATGACLLMRAPDFDRLGGFDEDFAVAYNDVDLCWRLAEQGQLVVVTPEPDILHPESVSRGTDVSGENRKRLYVEAACLQARYPLHFSAGDPLVHPLLSRESRRFEPAAAAPPPPQPSSDRLIWSWSRPDVAPQPGRPLLICVHWDAHGQLRPDLLEQLRQYRRHCQLVFVSACPELAADAEALASLQALCAVVLIRENEGHDFGSWKAAINYCWPLIAQAPRLILTNDSCYGPIQPLDDLFERLERSRADVVGLTQSTLVSRHLQSYFMAYRQHVVRAPIFRAFWESVGVWDDKRDLVRAQEIGWSTLLQRLGYSLEALYMSHYGNLSHTHWRELIESRRFPFIKKELLLHNPLGQDLADWRAVVAAASPVLAEQIADHLARQPRCSAPL